MRLCDPPARANTKFQPRRGGRIAGANAPIGERFSHSYRLSCAAPPGLVIFFIAGSGGSQSLTPGYNLTPLRGEDSMSTANSWIFGASGIARPGEKCGLASLSAAPTQDAVCCGQRQELDYDYRFNTDNRLVFRRFSARALIPVAFRRAQRKASGRLAEMRGSRTAPAIRRRSPCRWR